MLLAEVAVLDLLSWVAALALRRAVPVPPVAGHEAGYHAPGYPPLVESAESIPAGRRLRRPLHVHIPKTAGTSIRRALGLTDPPHLTAAELRAHVGDGEWNAGFSFAIVRNPFDRLLSIYSAGRTHNRARTRARFQSLEFCEWVQSELTDEDHPRLTARRCYHEWLNEPLDHVWRFEDMGEAWASIQEEAGVTLGELPVIHKTKHGHYREVFDEGTRKLVEAHYARDLDLYGYEF